jgi:ElaB/YqjD/DUF883 family membrane-anchored ribosome-binding protein
MQKTSRNHRKAVHNSVDDIRTHASGVGESVRELGDAVKDAVLEKFTELLKRALSLGDQGQEKARETAKAVKDNLEEKIQTKPYHAILMAVGVGFVLGLVLHRRS